MQRVFFNSNNDYKPSDKHTSDPLFIPLAVINDLKSQKNGTKKTVFWVKKKKKSEDGTIKGEKYETSEQYIGDWKENKKDGYGIKIYSNKDKYEGYWNNDLRNGKGTYWLCIGKNKYRKLYTGDWKNNKKEGHGIFFYKDGSCYDGLWKNNKRDGKGLMIYANEDIYEGNWKEDLKHGYGILEKKCGDKYYGFWNMGKKEGQGYYYYYNTGKIYLGEWHDDNPRCGIFTDVEGDTVKIDISKITDPKDIPSPIPELALKFPEEVLEESIRNVHFLRNIKNVKNKNLQELFPPDDQREIIKMYSQLRTTKIRDDENEMKIPDFTISIPELKSIIYSNLSFELDNDTLEMIFYALGLSLVDDTKVDFLLFVKIYYLIFQKINGEPEEENLSEQMFDNKNEKKEGQEEDENQKDNEGEENENEENNLEEIEQDDNKGIKIEEAEDENNNENKNENENENEEQ